MSQSGSNGPSREGGPANASAPSRSLAIIPPNLQAEAKGEDRAGTARATSAPDPAASAFAAQVLGQGGQKRGLKGGAPVLEEARSAYLETEWSGPNDRRLRTGRITRTEV